jgi:hypothetical protein
VSVEESIELEDGWLVISRGPSDRGRVRPLGLNVLKVVPEPAGSAGFVLLEPPRSYGRARNLVKTDGRGAIMWIAELPAESPTDSFVDVELTPRGGLVARTWSGNRVDLDRDTGRMLKVTFTK